MKKTIESTGEVCIKFTEEEMEKLSLKEGDKLSWRLTDEGILLEKFQNLEIDLSEFNRDILEFLIVESCNKDISVNDVICNILDSYIKND